MTTTIVGEDRSGGASVTKGDNFELRFRETYKFLVIASSTAVTREEVLLDTPGLPLVGVTYTATGARCISKSAERRTSHTLYWDVTCEFETSPEQQEQDSSASEDPTTWKPRFRVSFETKDQVLWEDKSSSPVKIVNSANQRFETPLMETKLICVVPFTQFETHTTTITDIMGRNNKVNSATFLGAALKTLLCNVVGAEKGFFGRYQAWRVSYQLKYDPDTWVYKMLDVGSTYIDTGVIKPYLDGDGHRIIGPLNGSGAKVASVTTAPALISFNIYETVAFSSFIRT